MRRERYRLRRLAALALSLGLHALIISLELGDPGLGLPGLALPWAERRVQAPPLAVRLVESSPPQLPASPDTAAPVLPGPAVSPRTDGSFEVVAPAPPKTAPSPKPLSRPQRESGDIASAAETPAPQPAIPAKPKPVILALDEARPETFSVPASTPPETEQPRAPEVAARPELEEEARRKAEAEEAGRKAEAEEARRKAEAERRKEAEDLARQRAEEEARQRALAFRKELEAKKQAAEAEEARRKAEVERRKDEEEKRLAAEAEALKRAEEAARQQAAARQKELEAQRLAEEAEVRRKAEVERRKEEEARRLAQAAAERERLAAEQARAAAAPAAASVAASGGGPAGAAPGPGALSGKELAAKVLGQLRTPGATPLDSPRPPPPPADPRRRSVFGVERDVVLRMYAESWRSKIERNGPLNYRPSAGMRASEYPIVTVAIRSDGSLEHVHIHRSSGLRELDNAVRQIVEFYAPYSKFPPALANQYDVIEIRRVWQFDSTLRLVEETR